MRIQFDYAWYNDEKTVLKLTARPNWNWKDYHAAAHAAQFALMNLDGPVHMLIDLRPGERENISGVSAHARSFGKRLTPKLSGNAVVIGMPAAAEAQLKLGDNRTLHTSDGEVRFVDTDAEAEAALAAL